MEYRQLAPFVLIESDVEICSISEVTLENYSSNFHIAVLWNYSLPSPTPIRISEAMSSELNVVISQVIEAVKSTNIRRNRYGEDLYVRRTDGFEKIYKNNSDNYRAKANENHFFRKTDTFTSNPKLASRLSSEAKPEGICWKKTKRRNFKRSDPGQKAQERVSFADITNIQPRKLEFL